MSEDLQNMLSDLKASYWNRLKETGGQLLYNQDLPIKKRAEGLEMFMLAHFDRSSFSFLTAGVSGHPDYYLYAEHYLKANEGRYEHEVEKCLIKKYGKSDESIISKGGSYIPLNWKEMKP